MLNDFESPFRIVSEAFKLNEGEVARPVKGRRKVYIIKLVKIKPETDAAFEEVADKVRAAAQKEAARSFVAKRAEIARSEIASGANPEAVAGKYGLEVETTGIFSRASYGVPKLSAAKGLLEEAFALTMNNPVAKMVYPVGDNSVVAWLDEREKADNVGFEAEKEKITQMLLNQKQQMLFQAYLDDAMERYKIEKNVAFTSKFEKAPKFQFPGGMNFGM